MEDDGEEEFEIDINEQEPAFLKGQSTKNGGEVSPVKIVANPDGSLQVKPICCRNKDPLVSHMVYSKTHKASAGVVSSI